MKHATILSPLAFLAIASCSLPSGKQDGGAGAGNHGLCQAGAEYECDCDDGSTGTSICNYDGRTLSICHCEEQGGMAGNHAVGSSDSGGSAGKNTAGAAGKAGSTNVGGIQATSQCCLEAATGECACADSIVPQSVCDGLGAGWVATTCVETIGSTGTGGSGDWGRGGGHTNSGGGADIGGGGGSGGGSGASGSTRLTGTLAAAVTRATPVLSGQAGTTFVYDVDFDVLVLDGEGHSVGNVATKQATWQDSSWSDPDGTTVQQNDISNCTARTETSGASSVSVVLLMDQSGSISSTDPNDYRISGAREFLASLEPGDEVGLMSFAESGTCSNYSVTAWGNGFTSDGGSFDAVLKKLADCEAGGTPLWDAALGGLQMLKTASRDSKAMILFTDGQDTASTNSMDAVIARALADNVRIFTVGLGRDADNGNLAQVAQRSHGAAFPVLQVGAMISAFRGMNLLLTGSYDLYTCQTTLSVTERAAGYRPKWFSSWIDIRHGSELAKGNVFLSF